MAALNVMQTIKDYTGTGKINLRYDICNKDVELIAKNSSCTYEAICNSFVFGYAQGLKAYKAEMKRKAKAVKK